MTQGLCIKDWFSEICSKPLELIVGLSLFVTVAAGGAISHVASTSVAILFIVSLVYIRHWPSLWRRLGLDERLLLLGFCLYFFSAVFAYYNVSDNHTYVKHLDRYFRFILIIPVYLLFSKLDQKLFPYLLAAAVISGPLYLGAAFLSLAENVGLNARGGYHHITFGDMAMLNALFMIAVLVVMETSKTVKIVLVLSIFCLLYASVLSLARGAWLALPFGLLVLLIVALYYGKIKARTIVIVFVVLVAVVAVSPAEKILSSRIQKAAHEIELFQSGENAYSSVGSRLAMWHVAINVWKKYPIIGTGPGDYKQEFIASQEQGLYKDVDLHSSTHNIFFQALATTGTIGFIVLCLALFAIPFRLFYKTNRKVINIAGVGGMVVLTAFAVFGLTESWMLRSPAISVYLIYLATLANVASKKIDENPTP